MTPEGKLKKNVRNTLAVFEPLWYYMPVQGGFGKQGIPDFIVCANGKFFAIETKSDTGSLTGLQEMTLKLISDAGGVMLVLRPSDGLAVLVNYLQMCGCHALTAK